MKSKIPNALLAYAITPDGIYEKQKVSAIPIAERLLRSITQELTERYRIGSKYPIDINTTVFQNSILNGPSANKPYWDIGMNIALEALTMKGWHCSMTGHTLRITEGSDGEVQQNCYDTLKITADDECAGLMVVVENDDMPTGFDIVAAHKDNKLMKNADKVYVLDPIVGWQFAGNLNPDAASQEEGALSVLSGFIREKEATTNKDGA